MMTPLILLPLLGGPAPVEAATEQAPYVAYLDGIKQAEASALQGELANVPGVERVEIELSSSRAKLYTEEDTFLARAQVAGVLDPRGIKLAAFNEPQWTKIQVYVVTATGGG